MRLATSHSKAHTDTSLENVSRQMSDCATTLYNDLKVVLNDLGNYSTSLYNMMGLLDLRRPLQDKVDVFLTRHRVLENFLSQLLGEVWKFQRTIQQKGRKNDFGLLLLYESRLNGFYQDTEMLQGSLTRFEADYNAFIQEMEYALVERN